MPSECSSEKDAGRMKPDLPEISFSRGVSPDVGAWTSEFSQATRSATQPDVLEDNIHLLDSDEINGGQKCVNGVLNPNWIGRLGWDFGVIAVVLIDAMVLPFQMAYKHGKDPDGFDVMWLWLTTAFFAVDIMLNFFTGYVATKKDRHTEPGRLVTRPWRIARNYMRGWFVIDLVSTIPWSKFADLLTGGGTGGNSAQVAKLTKAVKFVRFLRLMRMLRLAKLGIIWERIEAKMGSLIMLQIMALVRVLFIVVSICHWNACIWWMVGQPRSLFSELMSEEDLLEWEVSPHWTTMKNAVGPDGGLITWIEKDTTEAYVFCFYWTLGVMRTMPSEVQPVNLAERFYVMLFMFFAVSAFAISVTLITQAFLKIGERKRIFNEDMAFARMHLRSIQASEHLQGKVKSFLTHLYDRRRIQAKELNLFGHLPTPLGKLMKYSFLMVHFSKVSVLQGLTKKALYAVSEISEVRDLMPCESLCSQGSVSQAAWVLVMGLLRIRNGNSPRKNSLGDAPETIEVVDEECLTTRKHVCSKHTIVTCACSETIVISKRKFFKVFKDNPDYAKGVHANTNSSLVRLAASTEEVCTDVNSPGAGSVRAEISLEHDSDGEVGALPSCETTMTAARKNAKSFTKDRAVAMNKGSTATAAIMSA